MDCNAGKFLTVTKIPKATDIMQAKKNAQIKGTSLFETGFVEQVEKKKNEPLIVSKCPR